MRPSRIALLVASPDCLDCRLFGPVDWCSKGWSGSILRMFGVRIGDQQAYPLGARRAARQVDLLHEEGSVEKHDRDMLGGLLDLRDLVVSDVMIHRTKMITACADDPPEEVVKAVLDCR